MITKEQIEMAAIFQGCATDAGQIGFALGANWALEQAKVNGDKAVEWKVESVDRFYYLSSRIGKTYKEVTFWYNPVTLERKETTRSESIDHGHEHKLPDWCLSCEYRPKLNYTN